VQDWRKIKNFGGGRELKSTSSVGDVDLSHHIKLNSAKISPPTLTRHEICRSIDVLESFLPHHKLVLFSAPAGFGKTTAMLQWKERLRCAGVETVWVTLDAQDNDAGRFLTYIVAALKYCSNATQKSSDQSSAFETQTTHLGELFDVIEELFSMDRPFAIFLDDYEAICNPAIHDIVSQVIDKLSAGCHLVIGSRTSPPLGIGKMRAHEQLIEVRAGQLRFSLGDTTRYFNEIRRLGISESNSAALYRSTEGWVTAIQLVSLSIKENSDVDQFVGSFSGNQYAVAEFLAEDVFSRQSPLIQEFLLKTSILSTLEASICNFLTERQDSAAILQQIEKANLFIVALDSARNSYRYHNLFADFLRSHLARQQPDQIVELNNRAAAWYQGEGVFSSAFDHAMAANNVALATDLLQKLAKPLLYRGHVATLIRYVESLPKDSVGKLIDLSLSYTLALILVHRYQEAKQALATLDQNNNLDEHSRDEVLTLGPVILLWTDQIEECLALATENQGKLSGRSEYALGVMINFIAIGMIKKGLFKEAREKLDNAKRYLSSVNNVYGLVYAECIDGIIHFLQGRLRASLAQYMTTFRYASMISRHSSPSAVAAVYLAEAWYEENKTDAADELLREYLPLIRQTGAPDEIIILYRVLCRIAFARGDKEQAQYQLSEMEHLGIIRGYLRVVSRARLEGARIALIQGNLELAASLIQREESEEALHQSGSGYLDANDLNDIKLYNIRLLLKTDASDKALTLLSQERDAAKLPTITRRKLLLNLLIARAQHLAGHLDSAYQTSIESLEFLAEEGHQRLILDEEYLLAPLLEDLLDKVRNHSGKVTKLLEQLTGRQASNLSLLQQNTVDALTRREMQVLELVALGMSNKEVANKLFLSDATIKSHVRNIISKLGANNRTQAISLAQKKRLLTNQ